MKWLYLHRNHKAKSPTFLHVNKGKITLYVQAVEKSYR